jgi:DNA-binding LacI/PurR family transcriptional regulator
MEAVVEHLIRDHRRRKIAFLAGTPNNPEAKVRFDAYQAAYRRYSFCAVCEFEDGWVTLLSETIWSSEVIRRVRPAAKTFDVYISRPQ